MSVEDDLRAVNESFYRAFRDRDLTAMERLWAQEVPVACMHPGMSVLSGRSAVMRSWRGILEHPNAPVLSCSHVEVFVLGTSAFITCLEGRAGHPPRLIATNVFTMEEGRWRIVHHHAAPLVAAPASMAETEDDEPSDPYELN